MSTEDPHTFMMNLDEQIEEAVSHDKEIEIFSDEYFDNASPALVHLFIHLLDTSPDPIQVPVLDVVEYFAPIIDGTADLDFERYRTRCVDRLIGRIARSGMAPVDAFVRIQLEINRLVNLPNL